MRKYIFLKKEYTENFLLKTQVKHNIFSLPTSGRTKWLVYLTWIIHKLPFAIQIITFCLWFECRYRNVNGWTWNEQNPLLNRIPKTTSNQSINHSDSAMLICPLNKNFCSRMLAYCSCCPPTLSNLEKKHKIINKYKNHKTKSACSSICSA